MIGTVDVVAGLYKLNASPILHFVNNIVITTITEPLCNKLPIDLWHLRLGHLSHDRMFLLKQYYPFLTVDKTFTCNTCHNAKQRKLPFPKSGSHATIPLALLHIDIWGPCHKTSIHGHKYFLTIVDEFSRYTWFFSCILNLKLNKF